MQVPSGTGETVTKVNELIGLAELGITALDIERGLAVRASNGGPASYAMRA